MRQDVRRALAVGHQMMAASRRSWASSRRRRRKDSSSIAGAARASRRRESRRRRASGRRRSSRPAGCGRSRALVGHGRVAAVADEEGTSVRPLLTAVEELVVPVAALGFAQDLRVAVDGPADGLAAFRIGGMNPEILLPLLRNRGLEGECFLSAAARIGAPWRRRR